MNRNQFNLHALYRSKYNSSRYSLLVMIAFTVLNVIIALTGNLTYYLFSANIPYTLVIDGMYITGKLPDEVYVNLTVDAVFYEEEALIPLVILAVAIIGFYLLCFFLSNKIRVGWLITAAAAFIIDTVFMLIYYSYNNFTDIGDLIMHGLMIYYLIYGIIQGFKFKKLPAEDEIADDYVPEVPFAATEQAPAPIIPEEPVTPEDNKSADSPTNK